jgi:hypothetical protein
MYRKDLVRQLHSLYSRRENVLLIGPAGIGKTTLLKEISADLPLLVCDEASNLGRVCDCLERKLSWSRIEADIIQRKNRLLDHLGLQCEAVAFDQVAEIPPRVARFIAHLIQKIPVWVACRSDRRRQIGHLWEHLYNFTRVEVPPLTLDETTAIVRDAVDSHRIQADARTHSGQLYHISKGVPGTLEALLTQLTARHYKMDSEFGLWLLDLDRQIHETTAETAKLQR